MFGKAKWGEKKETEQKQKAQIQAWIREANEQMSVRKQQDKMECHHILYTILHAKRNSRKGFSKKHENVAKRVGRFTISARWRILIPNPIFMSGGGFRWYHLLYVSA